MKKVISLLLISFLFLLSVEPIFAADIPSFPACTNPTGTIIATYDNGVHGIVGKTDTYTGKDTVYQVDPNTVVQCYCGADMGIQTNWMKASLFSDTDIQILRNQGYLYVPNGALWGLDPEPYLAQNNSYSCTQGSGSVGGSSSSGSNGSSNSTGSILAAAVSTVSSLAFTGGIILLAFFLTISIISFSLGIVLRKKRTH